MSYSVKELFDIAMGIEDIGYEFYTKCHNKFENQSVKDIFSFLAEEELRHKEIFEDMLKKMDITEDGNFTEEYFLYLKAIGNEMVFKDSSDVDKAISNIETLNDAIRYALHAEKDSLLWYTELRYKYTDNKEATLVLKNLINEEKKHIVQLVNLRDKFA